MQTLSEKRRTAALKHWKCEGRQVVSQGWLELKAA